MNWKILSIPASILASALVLATACEPCEGDECSFTGGQGGEGATEGSGGSSSGGKAGASGGSGAMGGAATGGVAASGGEAGSMATGGEAGAGAPNLDCQADGTPQGEPGSCEPVSAEGDPNYDCESCVQSFCCEEFEACNAKDPFTACRFGSTLLDGSAVEGEFDCMLTCLRDLPDAFGDEYDVARCAEECGAAECDPNAAGMAATSLISCMLGIGNQDYPLGCQDACQMLSTN